MPLTAAVIVLTSQMKNRTSTCLVESRAAGCRLPALFRANCAPTGPLPAEGELDLTLIWDIGSSRAGWLGAALQCTLYFWGLLNKEKQKWVSRVRPLLPSFQAAVGEVLPVPSFLRAIRSAVPFLKRPPQ